MLNTKKINYSSHLNKHRCASDKTFNFIPSEKKWKISLNTTLDVSFIYNSHLTLEQKEDLLNVLAFRVSNFSENTSKTTNWAINKFISNLEGELTSQSTQQSYGNLNYSYKEAISYSFKTFIEAGNTFVYEAFNVLYLTHCKNYKIHQHTRKIFDPNKGAHTPIELENLLEGMRILTRDMHQNLDKPRPFFKTAGCTIDFLMGGLGLVLIMSILRRPVQLRQIKMCDLRTNNGNFDTEFSNNDILLDYDELRLQTFRSKKKHSKERGDLDEDLHLLSRENSKLIIKYISKMFTEHLRRLQEKGISLSKKEKLEIFKRFPLFPTYSHIATIGINSKEQLFNATHTETTANHKVSESLRV
jgi:hypothetical protein